MDARSARGVVLCLTKHLAGYWRDIPVTLLAAKIVLGNHLDADAVVFRRAARVSIRSRPGMWFTVDGELIGNDPIVFEVMPCALQFVVGKRWGGRLSPWPDRRRP